MSRIKSISINNFKEIENISLRFKNDVSVASKDNLEDALEYFNSNTITSKDSDTLVSVLLKKEEDEVIFLSSLDGLMPETQKNMKKFENGEEVEIHKLSNGHYSFAKSSSNQKESEYLYNEIISKIPKKLSFEKVDKRNGNEEEFIFTIDTEDSELIKLLNEIAIGRVDLKNNSLIIKKGINHPLFEPNGEKNIIIDKSFKKCINENGIFKSLKLVRDEFFMEFKDIIDLKPNSIVLVDKNKEIIGENAAEKLNIKILKIDSNKFQNIEGEIEVVKQLNSIFGDSNIENGIKLFELKQENDFLKNKIKALETDSKKLSNENKEHIKTVNNAEEQIKALTDKLDKCGATSDTEDIKKLLILALELIDSKEDSTKELFRKFWISLGNDIKK